MTQRCIGNTLWDQQWLEAFLLLPFSATTTMRPSSGLQAQVPIMQSSKNLDVSIELHVDRGLRIARCGAGRAAGHDIEDGADGVRHELAVVILSSGASVTVAECFQLRHSDCVFRRHESRGDHVLHRLRRRINAASYNSGSNCLVYNYRSADQPRCIVRTHSSSIYAPR